jgi:hypothetical protein
MAEKYIVAVRQWGLGFLKETVFQGNVIAVDRVKNTLTIDGRVFSDVRDIDIAIRQAENCPSNPLIVPFTEENLARLKSSKQMAVMPKTNKTKDKMEVITSDEDLHNSIDISDTQISRKSKEAKEAERSAAKNDKLTVIVGDEKPEDRVQRLKYEELKKNSMPIVRDDSLGVETGSKGAALNAGQKLPSRAEVTAKEALVRAEAEARKRQANAKRQAIVEGDAAVTRAIQGEDVPSVPAPIPAQAVTDARFADLENKFSVLAGSVNALTELLTKSLTASTTKDTQQPPPIVSASVPVAAETTSEGTNKDEVSIVRTPVVRRGRKPNASKGK